MGFTIFPEGSNLPKKRAIYTRYCVPSPSLAGFEPGTSGLQVLHKLIAPQSLSKFWLASHLFELLYHDNNCTEQEFVMMNSSPRSWCQFQSWYCFVSLSAFYSLWSAVSNTTVHELGLMYVGLHAFGIQGSREYSNCKQWVCMHNAKVGFTIIPECSTFLRRET